MRLLSSKVLTLTTRDVVMYTLDLLPACDGCFGQARDGSFLLYRNPTYSHVLVCAVHSFCAES